MTRRDVLTAYQSDVVLGERYRDAQTGLEGIATSTHFYQFGCERVTIEVLKKDGELQEYTFDSPRLVNVATDTALTTTKTGGPEKATDRGRGVPTR